MKHLYTLIILLLSLASFGQSMNTLRGKVLTEDNVPISNVHIQVKGTNIGTVSNSQGTFKLKIPKKYCDSNLIFSHISYFSIPQEVFCEKKDYLVILPEKTFELDEVKVSAMSAQQIVANAILNLNKNYQIDSVNYTIFSRLTEQIENEPILIEESVFNLYHENKTRPEFNVIKVRGCGFDKLGEQRFDKARLIDIHSTENHLMLRYIPNFLKKTKMRKYEYDLLDEIFDDDNSYFVIDITSNEYLKGGIIHVNKDNFGIRYMKIIYDDEDWTDMSKTNTIRENYYIQDSGKWYFTHGSREQVWHLKKEDIRISSYRVTVATNRTDTRSFNKSDEMGRMSKMLKDFKGSFNDEFWGQYNYIPVDEKFERSLTNAKNP